MTDTKYYTPTQLLGEALKVLSKGTGIPVSKLNHFWIVDEVTTALARHTFYGEKAELDDIPPFTADPNGPWHEALRIVDSFIDVDGPWSEYRDNVTTLHYIVERFTAESKAVTR